MSNILEFPQPPELPVHNNEWFVSHYAKLKEYQLMELHQLIHDIDVKANTYGGTGHLEFIKFKRLEVTKFLVNCFEE